MYKTVVKIDGMMCGMCESHINDVIRKNFKVKKVSSSHTKNQSVIESEEKLDEEAVKKAINDTGYTYVSMEVSEAEAKKFSLFSKK